MNMRSFVELIAPRGERRLFFVLTFFVLVIAWTIPYWKLKNVVAPGALLPLHYNVHLGVDYAGPWYVSLFFPGFATVVLIVNTLLASWVRKQSKLLEYTLVISALCVALFTVLALFFVLVLNA